MPGQLLQCACGHEFELGDADYGKMGRCARCNRPMRAYLRRGDVFLEPVEGAGGFDLPLFGQARKAVAEAPPPHAADDYSGPTCARCGKGFRGEWDQRPTEHGVYCYICSTLAVDAPPQVKEETPAFEIIAMAPTSEFYFPAFEEADERGSFWEHVPAIALSLSGALVLLAIVLLPVETLIPSLLTSYTEDDLKNAPEHVTQFAEMIPYLTLGLALFIWVYCGLAATGSLPNSLVRHNIIVAAVYAIGLFLLNLTTGTAFGMGIYIGFSDIFIMTVLMYYMFDLEFYDTIKLVVIGVVTALLLPPVTMALQGLYLGAML